MKAGDIVRVEWDDHCYYGGEYADGGLASQKSVGYLVSEDENTIRIAQTLVSYEGTRDKPCEVLVIDKRTMVRARKVR